MHCGTCGRTLHWRWNPRAGYCSQDGLFECRHCTGLARSCPVCGDRVKDTAYSVLFIGGLVLILSGSLVGGLIVPLALTNERLDGIPVTPLSAVAPGNTYKIFATIAPNQSDVIYGYWSEQTWTWTIRPFLVEQDGRTLLVNASGLVNLREPGGPWGSQSGVVLYGSGDSVAVYGTAERVGNQTVLRAQYISGDPSAMGKTGGDLLPLFIGSEGLFTVVTAVGTMLVVRQRRRHSRESSRHPPTLPSAVQRPPHLQGEVHQFADGGASRRDHQYKMMLILGSPFAAIGIALMATDLLLPVFVGLFLLLLGGFFLLLGTSGRVGRWRELTAIQTDDSGMWIQPLLPLSYPDDQYIPWSELDSFSFTGLGSLGSLLALHTRRGEFLLGSLGDDTGKQVAAELRLRRVPELKDWKYRPSFSLARA